MIVSLLHFHLRPGGVTTVIRNAARALSRRHEVRVLSDFGYDERPSRGKAAFDKEARLLLRALPRTGLLHTHNIGLGKNPRLAMAVRLLAERGDVWILNQVHDFPEEGRPAQIGVLQNCTGRRDVVFWRRFCYYDRSSVMWATLTSSDAAKLASRGVPADRIEVLPNPVDDELFGRPAPDLASVRAKLGAYAREHGYRFNPAGKILLSPMKVMIRKNTAEAVELIRRLPGHQLIVSLDASSAADRAYSEELKQRIRGERLPVVIGFGATLPDPLPLFHLADAILTTSRQEGFGYAFLEGWLCGKVVVGRDIPEVTADFKAAGVRLEHMYSEPDTAAVAAIRRLVERPPISLISHNRRTIREQYSLAAYALRYERIIRRFEGMRVRRP